MPKRQDSLGLSDEKFFNEFYARNQRLIFYFAKRYTANSADREDLAHDVVIRLMNRVPSLRALEGHPGKESYYICTTTQSAFIDRYRQDSKIKHIPYPEEMLDSLIEERLYAQRTPFDSVYWDVQLLKEKLPTRDWSLLEGKYIVGYSDEELSKFFKCSKDSIRMALSRARKKARKLIFESNSESGESNEQ